MKQIDSQPPPPASRLMPVANGADRDVPEEVPVALTYNRDSYAVMLATPADLRDFAVGFSLNEGLIEHPGDIEDLDVVTRPHGIELRMWLPPAQADRLVARRRRLAGPTGCGLCGLESLADAVRAIPPVASDARFTGDDIIAAMAALPAAQLLNQRTHAVHAAGLWREGLIAVREDVGRHNAVDKLAGAVAEEATATAMLLLTSRVSIELVQKAARMGIPLIAAISVPTALAIRTAGAAGITLVGVARGDSFEVFSNPDRIKE
jgi:FdhD protein